MPAARFMTSPAPAAPNAVAHSCTVMSEVAARSCSPAGASRNTAAPSHVLTMPTAAPPADRAMHIRSMTAVPASHGIKTASDSMDSADRNGAPARNRRRLAGEAPEPKIAATVQPADSRAAPKPAASGDWPCSACRNSGTKASVQVTVTANRADTAYSAPSGPDSWNAPIGNNRRDADDSVRTNAQASIAASPRQGTLHGNG